MSKFLKGLLKTMGDDYASVASDGIVGSETSFYADTGNYALNALVSGSIFKGVPSNKRLAYAGESSTGKTFFALETCYHFLNEHPDGNVIYFDTEKSIDDGQLEKRGLDASRVIISQPSTIEEWRTYAIKILDDYAKIPEEDRPKLMMVLDSQGMLSSLAETENMLEGKNVADMKKSQLLKAAYRVLTLKTGLLNVPFIVVAHTYDKISMYGGKEIGGGSGLKYGADYIITLSKSKVEGAEEGSSKKKRIGAEILCKAYKSRKVREETSVRVRLLYEHGLDRYSGLLELAALSGAIKKVGVQFEVEGEEKKVYGKHIAADPKRYFNDKVLKTIDEWVQENFTLSGTERDETFAEILDDDEAEG